MFPRGYVDLVSDRDASPATTDERLAVERSDGMSCAACDEWTPKAEPNRKDGKFVCYLCRQNPWRPGVRRDVTRDGT